MADLVNISIPTAGGTALLGYLVVFFGLVLLMIVLLIMGSVFEKKRVKAEKAAAIPAPTREAPVLTMENTLPALEEGMIVRAANARGGFGKPATIIDTVTGVENVQSDDVQCIKVIENGVLYIIKNGAKYNAQGTRIQ